MQNKVKLKVCEYIQAGLAVFICVYMYPFYEGIRKGGCGKQEKIVHI